MYLLSSFPFPGSSTFSFHISQPSLTPPVRDAHPVSYSFLFPAGRKWLESTDTQTAGAAGRKWSHCSTCNQEIEQTQQGGGRTGSVHTHTYMYTNKRLTHKHPLTSPTAVGTGTTTQETECEQSSHVHTVTAPLLRDETSSSFSFINTCRVYKNWQILIEGRQLGGLLLEDLSSLFFAQGCKVNNFLITAIIQFGARVFQGRTDTWT